MNNKGQSLYYFLIFTMVIFISWAMMLNITKLVKDRMIMQNIADTTALKIANHKARVMNFVGNLNYLMAEVLACGTQPEFVQTPSFNTQAIGSYPLGDVCEGVHKKSNGGVKILANAVEAIQALQDWAIKNHEMYIGALETELALKGYAFTTDRKYKNAKYFGLKRNSKGIKFLNTYNSGSGDFSKLHMVYNPFPLLGPIETIYDSVEALNKKEENNQTNEQDIVQEESLSKKFSNLTDKLTSGNGNTVENLMDLSNLTQSQDFNNQSQNQGNTKKQNSPLQKFINNFFPMGDMENSPIERYYKVLDYSWYVMDENFYDQKIRIKVEKIDDTVNEVAEFLKKGASVYKTPKPLLKKFMGLSNLIPKEALSSASIYNTKGTMFPKKESIYTGLPLDFDGCAIMGAYSKEVFQFLKRIGTIAPKYVTVAFGIYLGALLTKNLATAVCDIENSPIQTYKDACNGGWSSHLVPYYKETNE